jgi:serralysin
VATLNVPGSFPTIAAAVAAASPGDIILIAGGFGDIGAIDVTVNNLLFSAPAGVGNVSLVAGAGVQRITLDGDSPIRLTGNSANDRLTGNAGANEISDGGEGNDTIRGGAGDDVITSTGGTDTLSGDDGNDSILIDDDGDGTVSGGAGVDTVYSVDLSSFTFTSVETFDTYYGFATASRAQLASFANIRAGLADADAQISISLRGTGGFLDFTTKIQGDNSIRIQDVGLSSGLNVVGSANGDFLGGSIFSDILQGAGGDDTLVGGTGHDTLIGGGGVDLIAGGLGNDILTGNGDGDTATYFDAGGVRVNLAVTSPQFTLSAGWDTLTGISNLVGSDGADHLMGDGSANALDGRADHDTMFGAGGADTLDGGDGNDKLVGGAGADHLDGGAGRDRAQYSDATAGLRADLQDSSINTGIATGDTYLSIENLVGSDFRDNLRGDAGDNGIWGKAGDDSLYGRDGDDILSGGNGNDTLNGGAGRDTFVFNTFLNTATNVDTISGFSVAEDTIRLDNAIFATLLLGVLAADAFFIGPAAQDAQDRLIYNSATGALLYDADGIGGGAAVQFATLGTGLMLTNNDFLIV